MDQFVVVDVQSTMKSDSLATSHPIYVPVQHPDEVNEIFDSISYGKVRIFIHNWRSVSSFSLFCEVSHKKNRCQIEFRCIVNLFYCFKSFLSWS